MTVMTANNEIGVLQPVAELSALARRRGVLFHTDATQAVGKVPFDVVGLDDVAVSTGADGLYVSQSRTVARLVGAGSLGPARPCFDSVRARPLEHTGRGRLRGREGPKSGRAVAANVTGLTTRLVLRRRWW